MQTEFRYAAPARWLHWITVALLLAIGVLGVWITRFEPADEGFKTRLYHLHENLGLLAWCVVLLRVVVRWRLGVPAYPDGHPAPLRAVAQLVQRGMYVVLLAQPLVGFLGTNAWGFPVTWFGLVDLPSPMATDTKIAPVLSWLHYVLALLLAGLISLHLGGALFHGVVRRDGLIRRML